jgi:hypothetical protein
MIVINQDEITLSKSEIGDDIGKGIPDSASTNNVDWRQDCA